MTKGWGSIALITSLVSASALLLIELGGHTDRAIRYLAAGAVLIVIWTSYKQSVEPGGRKENRSRLRTLYFTACLVSAAHFMVHAGFEGGYYRLADVLSYRADVPFGHRLLLVWLGLAMRAAVPGFTNLQYFFATQVVMMAAAGFALYHWTKLFVDRDIAALSSAIGMVMWMVTYSYYNFYDIGIVFFFAGCLYAAYSGRWKLYVVLFAIGIFNHEIMLLIVPISAAVFFRENNSATRLIWFVTFQLCIYATFRVAMFWLLPQPAAFNWQFWVNVDLLTNQRAYVVKSTWKLAVIFAVALGCVRYAPPSLRITLALFPLLVITTSMFGRFAEARQFDAFIPAATAFILCAIAARYWPPASVPEYS